MNTSKPAVVIAASSGVQIPLWSMNTMPVLKLLFRNLRSDSSMVDEDAKKLSVLKSFFGVQIPLWSMNTVPAYIDCCTHSGSDSSMVDEYGVVQAIIFIWERVAPVLAVQWEIIKNLFFVAVETIIGVVGGVLRTFSGIIDFLTGVFTGNWELAWQGIVDIFGGIFDGLVALAKAPLNAIIGLINGVITGLNKISLPDWVPGLGGKGVNIPLIPKLATGTLSWPGGIAQVHERGGEIIDLPKGSRVYPHDESVRMARERGRTEASKHISIEKLADTLIVREEADINKIATALVKKLAQAELAYGGDW